jgi:hypothetical protein
MRDAETVGLLPSRASLPVLELTEPNGHPPLAIQDPSARYNSAGRVVFPRPS